jgi:hypothetical protein
MKRRYTLPVPLLVFVTLATGIVATGYLLYRSQLDRYPTGPPRTRTITLQDRHGHLGSMLRPSAASVRRGAFL